MPIQIGARPLADFNSPVDMMEDCHRRIEQFLQLLRTIVAQTTEAPLNGEQSSGLQRALAYFERAAPRHTQDEEVSLFPRLRQAAVSDAEATAALARLDQLEDDHRVADVLHARVDEIGRRWIVETRLTADVRIELSGALDQLASIYQDHIKIEDAEVFPAARRLLASGALHEVGQEMRQRRAGGAVNVAPATHESR